jgi:Uma2 family endonuclease
MAQPLPAGYVFDPADPRAPSEAQWTAMTPAERARVVAMLPIEVPWELQPPEGDAHREAKERAVGTLGEFYRRAGRRIYVSSELPIFYPDEPRFSPDVFAVLDVEPHRRDKWTVADEGKGLDLVIEVHYAGDRTKDYKTNVERYARLGIAEYFVFDVRSFDLLGHRLPPAEGRKARMYRPILPQGGRWASAVLGLELAIDGDRIRFFQGNAPLLEAAELCEQLGQMLDKVLGSKREAEERLAAEAEARRLAEERAAAEVEARRALEERVADLEQRLREAEAEIARNKGNG